MYDVTRTLCSAYWVCVWAGGFTVPSLARDSGLEVDRTGRILTDRHLRAVGDDDIWALGDAAAVPGPWGDALAMGCRTGGFTAPAGADNVAAALTGGRLRELDYRYFHECISLGRRRGLVQFLREDGSPRNLVLRGRLALCYKEATLRSVVVVLRWPGPYLPRRRCRVASTPGSAADAGRPAPGAGSGDPSRDPAARELARRHCASASSARVSSCLRIITRSPRARASRRTRRHAEEGTSVSSRTTSRDVSGRSGVTW